MGWDYEKARFGNHELLVWKVLKFRQAAKWVYSVSWNTETANTTVGRGSEEYEDVHGAREAAVLHLANILPKPQAQRLLSEQSELVWEPWFTSERR